MGLKISSATQIQPDTQTATKVEKKVVNQNAAITDKTANGGVYNKKAVGENLAANAKQRLNATFNAQQTNPAQQTQQENKEIYGVTTTSKYQMGVETNESQESVLRRSYHEFAFKAHLSTESEDAFVENRIEDNKVKSNGVDLNNSEGVDTSKLEAKIFHSKTGEAYTPTEWKERQEAGFINMSPTESDIAELKKFKANDDYASGAKLGDRIDAALKEGDSWSLDKLIRNSTATDDLHKALDQVKYGSNNPNLQLGLINRLGAEKFLRLESMLKDTGYDGVMRSSLSTSARAPREYYNDETNQKNVGAEIARKADAPALARLTGGGENSPMTKDFLVEAGKRVVKEGVGYKAEIISGSPILGIPSTALETVNPDAEKVLTNIAQNKDASLELLQDADVVSKGLKLSSMTSNSTKDTGINAILISGTSPEARAANPRAVDNALRLTAEALEKPNAIKPMVTSGGQNLSQKELVSSATADALATVYRNNADSFYEASDVGSKDEFDKNGVNNLFKAMNQYESSKEIALTTTKAKVAELLYKSAVEDKPVLSGKAIVLAHNLIDAEESVLLAGAKDADKRQERFADLLSSSTDVIGRAQLKNLGVQGVISDIVVKGVAAEIKRETKGNNVETAQKEIKIKTSNANDAKKILLLTAFEKASFAKANGDVPTTKENKAKAEEFLKNLRDFNEQLADEDKILDGNGRLMNAKDATPNQLARFQIAVRGGYASSMKNKEKAIQASDKLAEAMRETAVEMSISKDK